MQHHAARAVLVENVVGGQSLLVPGGELVNGKRLFLGRSARFRGMWGACARLVLR